MEEPGSEISLRPPSSSITTSVIILQMPQLKSPSRPFCLLRAGSPTPLHTFDPLRKEKRKKRRLRKLSLYQLRKRRHIGSKEP
eukprot:1157129-Pelagomonas_calceolata.AAC.2